MFNLETASNSRFEFQIEGSEQVYVIPSSTQLPVKFALQLSEAAKGDDATGALSAFLGLLERECGEELTQTLTIGQLNALVEAWQAEGVSVGESQA